ncbi:low temperature requirement protein A [Lacticaseibacillus brantae]|uniref:Low temperature requirement protein A n=1 Tax=Lacticaseibacillus brantae DSM 23927 TaxID=1423727 RepID=A0A0R2B739_9LACO|nr:low temperature requirement protein A [Lacticaseibacillus brantae]KRM71459.1 hypothetical protein FC34_GL001572 [Lacticaseibacillus brantae DSM 23927]
MPEQAEKAVSMPELFYDLIYAYAIGRMTQAVATPTYGQIPWLNLLEFLMMFLVFWNLWSYQTVFANRFYTGKLVDNLFLFIDMFLVIYLSTALNIDFAATKVAFQLSTGILLISVGLQYLIANRTHPTPMNKPFMLVLFATGIVSALSIIPDDYRISFGIFLVATLAASFGPIFLIPLQRQVPTHFDHLTERYSLFTLLIFGEAVIAVADVLHHGLTVNYVGYFVVIVLMFISYIQVYESGIDRHRRTSGMAAIQLHYPMLVGNLLSFTFIRLWLEGELNAFWFLPAFGISFFLYVISLSAYLATYRKPGIDVGHKRLFYLLFSYGLFIVYGLTTVTMPLLFLLGLIAYLVANNLYLWQFVLHPNR